MLFILEVIHLHIVKLANSSGYDARELEYGSLHGAKVGEHNGVSFVELSRIYDTGSFNRVWCPIQSMVLSEIVITTPPVYLIIAAWNLLQQTSQIHSTVYVYPRG